MEGFLGLFNTVRGIANSPQARQVAQTVTQQAQNLDTRAQQRYDSIMQQYKAAGGDPSSNIHMRIDPATNNIQVFAPDWYTNSPEYQNTMGSLLKQIEGRPINDIQVQALMSSDILKKMRQEASEVRRRVDAVREMSRQIPGGVSDDEALIALRNARAALQSDNDKDTLVTWFGKSGEEHRSVASVMKDFKEMSDTQRAGIFQGYQSILDSKTATPRQKATAYGLQQFMLGKNLLEASAGTQFVAGGDSFIAETDKGAVGWLVNQLQRPVSLAGREGWRTPADLARERLENNPAYGTLTGLETAMTAGSLTGTLGTMLADVVATAPVGGVVGATAGRATLGGGRVAKSAQTLVNSFNKLENSGTAGRFVARNLQEIPQEVAFSGLQTAARWGDYDGIKETMQGLAFNAGILAAPRLIKRTLNAVDPDALPALARVNSQISNAINAGWTGFTGLPVINKAARFVGRDVVDGTRDGKRLLRQMRIDDAKNLSDDVVKDALPGIGNRAVTKGDRALAARELYRSRLNDVALYREKGAQLSKVFREGSDSFKEFQRAAVELSNQSPQRMKEVADYVNAVQVRQYVDAGRKSDLSEEMLQRIDDTIAKHANDAEANAYRDLAVRANEDLNRAFPDVQDLDLFERLKADEAFRDGYVHLQKQLNPDFTFRFEKNPKWKNRGQTRRLTKQVAEEYVDPLVALTQKSDALAELTARARMNQYARQAIDRGLITGRILQEPATVKEFKQLNHILRVNEKEATQAIIDGIGKDLAEDMTLLIDDISDLYGPGAKRIDALMDTTVDDMLEQVGKEKRFDSAREYIRDNMPNGYTYSDDFANAEILSNFKKDINKGLDNHFKNVKGAYRLSDDEFGLVSRTLDTNLNEKVQIARATSQTEAVRTVDGVPTGGIETPVSLRAREDELKRLRADIETPQGNTAIPIWEDGSRGFIEIDDPVVRDFFLNQSKNPTDMGLFGRLMMNSARVFREMTTGLNPVFGMMVNPARDVPFSTITMGTGMIAPLSPNSGMRHLMSELNIPREQAEATIRRMEATAGGGTRVQAGRLPDAIMDQTRRDVRGMDAVTRRDRTVNVFRELKDRNLRVIEDINPTNVGEEIIRKQASAVGYAKAKARGMSDELAEAAGVQAYRDAITDFGNIGSKISSFTKTVPYLAAGINGKASFMRMWELDPIGVTSRLAAGVVAPLTAISMYNMRDDDTAAAYLDIPEWERRNNLIVMLPGGQNLKVPLPQEILGIVNPFVESVEALHGTDRSVFDIMQKALVKGISPGNLVESISPADLSGFGDANMDTRGAVSRAIGSVTPQALRSPMEIAIGRDSYTGQELTPSDEQIRRDFNLEPDQEITPGMRVRFSQNSRSLGWIADRTGISQGVLNNIFKNYTGGVGQFALNAVDTLAQAPEDERGGRSILENAAQRFFGKSYSQASQDYWRGVNQLEVRKTEVQQQLQEFSRLAYGEPGREEELMERRQALIDEYGEEVGEFAKEYGDFYQQTGGLKPWQIDSVIRLLNFAPDRGTFGDGTWQQGEFEEAIMSAGNEARERAIQVGIPTSNERDRYGRLWRDQAGELVEDYSKTNLITPSIQQAYYNAPRQAVYEFEQALKGDKRAGIPTLNTERQVYWDRLGKLYDQADGLKGSAARAIYDQIHALQEEYMAEKFDPRIRPVLEKWGPGILTNNKVVEELAGQIMIPGNFTPFHSQKKTPYLTRDTAAYIRDRYGVGDISYGNMPTSAEAQQMIRRINTDIENGNTGAASFRFDRLQRDIEAGNMFVDNDTMNYISSLLNRRR